MFEKIKDLKKRAALAVGVVGGVALSALTSLAVNASGGGETDTSASVITAMTSAFTTAVSNIMSALSSILPVVIPVVGIFSVIFAGMKIYKKVTKG